MGEDDFYEDDEPVERIRALFDEGPHGLTMPPAGHNLRIEGTGTWAAEVARLTADRDALAAVIEQVRALLDGCDACALADEITELLPEVSP